jgi:hypothetical protein
MKAEGKLFESLERLERVIKSTALMLEVSDVGLAIKAVLVAARKVKQEREQGPARVAARQKRALEKWFAGGIVSTRGRVRGFSRVLRDWNIPRVYRLTLLLRRPVVYILLRGRFVVYVGMSGNILGRLAAHFSGKKFDEVLYIPMVDIASALDLEMRLIALFSPEYNHNSGWRGHPKPRKPSNILEIIKEL